MASKRNSDTTRDAGGAGVGWKAIIPLVGAALAAAAPAATLGVKAVRERRDQSSRTPGLLVIPVVGGLLAALAAVAWRNRERVVALAGEALATAEGLASRMTEDAAADDDADLRSWMDPAPASQPAG